MNVLDYLNLEIKQNENDLYEKNINKYIENIIKNIHTNHKFAVFTILKQVMIEEKCNKQEILNRLKIMHKIEELEKLEITNLMNKQSLNKFMKLDENERRELLQECSNNLNEQQMKSNEFENTIAKVDENLEKIIKNEKYLCIEYNHDNTNKRIIYLYDNGTVIAIDIKKQIYTSLIIKLNKNKIDFIKNIIYNQIKEMPIKFNVKMYINDDNRISYLEEGIFYIILLLLNEKKELNNKIFFEYDVYFIKKFKSDILFLKKEEKAEKYIFYNWCPLQEDVPEIINNCKSIINKINIDFDTLSLLELKKFANYYWINQNYETSLELYNELINQGVDIANIGFARYYKLNKNSRLAAEYSEKAQKTIMSIFEELTRKRCYKIELDAKEDPNIFDSKLGGYPYLPIREKWPSDENGNLLDLIIQINFENIDLEDFPKKGILQVYGNVIDLRKSKFKVRFYENTNLDYQKSFHNVKIPNILGITRSTKINLENHYTVMPNMNRNFKNELDKTIKLYNKKIGETIYKTDFDDIDYNDINELFYNNEKIYPILLGGYSDYTIPTLTSDGWECESRNKECLIKIVDKITSTAINIVISKKELAEKRFENAEVFYMD